MDRFFFPATTGTHADVLAPVGLASLLRPAGDCTISDVGSGFEVMLDPPLDLEAGTAIGDSAGYLFLKPNAKTRVPSGVGEVLDYVVEKARVDAYREAQKAARAAGAEIAEEVDASKPRRDWRLYQALNALQGDDAANNIVKASAVCLPPSGASNCATLWEHSVRIAVLKCRGTRPWFNYSAPMAPRAMHD